ncbi:MAG: hypothetical protein GU356_00435 [Pyrobaculum sp.]|jgi:hypothetical protein|nr:hypothetical protein [Pyrobaculum sp.]
MRLHLIIAIIALAALAAAQTAQTGPAIQIINLPSTIDTSIGELAYNFVNQRTGPNVVAVPLPAAAYKDYGNIKLIVVAIPYSPEEDPDQAISNAINELVNSNEPLDTRINNAISDLLSIRSVFYPYETFRIRLIFIMFVHTQDLIDYAIQASQNLYSGTQNQSPDAGAALYTNTIMEILYARYQNWRNSELQQLEDEVNGFTLQSQASGDTIQFTGYAEGKPVLGFSVTVKLQVKENTEGSKTITICNLSSTVNNISEGFTYQLENSILNTLPTLTQDEISRIFAGINVKKDSEDNVAQGLIYAINAYYNSAVTPVWLSYQNSIINYIRSKFTMTEIETCNSQSCSCENLKNQFINSLLQETNNVQEQLRENYMNMLYVIDNEIYGNLSVVNKIESSLLPSCSGNSGDLCSNVVKTISDMGAYIASNVASVATSCLTSYLSSVAQTGVNSIVSTIPGVDLAYMVANGIFGALQDEITIKGTIVSEPAKLNGFELAGGLRAFKVYNVSSEVACYSSDIRDVSGQNFVSGPSPSEAILAGIKGFASAIAQLFSPEAGQVIDLIPIVREVDMPQNGYFMFGSTPGIYVLNITNLDAKNIVSRFEDDMIKSITNGLDQSYTIGYSSRLYYIINYNVEQALKSLSIGNFAGLYNKAYDKISGGNYDYDSKVNDNTKLTLSLYFIVIPPYMVGERLGSGYINYTPSADIFGLLRSFFFPAIGDIRQKMIQTLLQPRPAGADFCSQSGQPASTGTSIENFVSSSCSDAVNTVTEDMLKPIVNKIVNNIVNSINNVGTGLQGQESQDQCSVEGLLADVTENAINIFKSSLKDQINETVFNNIITPLSNKITSGICAPLGNAVNSLAGGELSSLFGDLLGAYGASFLQGRTPDLTGAVCGLMGGSQTISYLGLYATKVFDAVEEGLYVPSYFLSAYPIEFEESPTVRWCYGAVVSPYFVYVQPPPPTTDEEKKQLLIGALDVIRKMGSLQAKFYDFLRENKMDLSFVIFSEEIPAAKDGLVACNSSYIGVKWSHHIVPTLVVNPYGDYSWCLEHGDLAWTINSLVTMTDNVGLFDALSTLRGQHIVDLPVLVGVNKYFDALQVYPAIVVRENGNPNPYYFVVPYSTPARELYVLGTAGNVVVYDGSTAGQTNKPFLYYDISK